MAAHANEAVRHDSDLAAGLAHHLQPLAGTARDYDARWT
jgi:hypothetical protein